MGVPRSRCLSAPHPSFPSSHWGFHVADAARRGAPMYSSLPPTSFLACTLYWPHCLLPRSRCSPLWSHLISCLHPIRCHVPLPPQVNLHIGRDSIPSVSHLHSLMPAPSTPVPAASSSPLTSTWGFHEADAAHRGVTMPPVYPHTGDST